MNPLLGKGRRQLCCGKQILLGLPLLFSAAHAQQLQSLDKELNRIGTETALIMPAQDVQEYPLWSPQGDSVAVNIQGAWQKIDLSLISLKPSSWPAGQRIGVINSSSISGAAREEIGLWRKGSRLNPQRVTTKSGTRVEFKLDDLRATTSMVITARGKKPLVLWTGAMENCHSLVLSPDESYVAFISEMTGLLVMRLADFE